MIAYYRKKPRNLEGFFVQWQCITEHNVERSLQDIYEEIPLVTIVLKIGNKSKF